MTQVLTLALNLTLGSALGAIFYGGLWWTVQRLSATCAGPRLLASFVVRSVIVLAGFHTIARGPWYGFAACTAGFLAVRVLLTRLTQMPSGPRAVMPS